MSRSISSLSLRNGLLPTKVKIPLQSEPYTLLELIRQALPAHISTAEIITACEQGNVVDCYNNPLHSDLCLKLEASKSLSSVYIYRELPDEPFTNLSLPVTCNLDGAVVVNKPHGMATMPRGSFVARSLVVHMRRTLKNDAIIPAHRIDRLTGGIVLLVTDKTKRGYWQKIFQSGKVKKTYRALCEVDKTIGIDRVLQRLETLPQSPSGWFRLETWIQRPEGSLQSQIIPLHGAEPKIENRKVGIKKAVTIIRILNISSEIIVSDNATGGTDMARIEHPQSSQTNGVKTSTISVELRPLTGRTHQLRAHLAFLGMPILGDPLYPNVTPISDPRWNSEPRNCLGTGTETAPNLIHICASGLEIPGIKPITISR